LVLPRLYENFPFFLAACSNKPQGSGKTLAYGLPILHQLLSSPHTGTSKRPVRALILAPTRELALQVSSHLNACLNDINKPSGSNRNKRPPLVSVAAVVGGMSAQKQRRILDRGVDVLVATPGRLWDTIEEVESFHFLPVSSSKLCYRMKR
jgi:ATP-dependent RNA helicase DDX24/MAK5